MPDNRSEKVAC